MGWWIIAIILLICGITVHGYFLIAFFIWILIWVILGKDGPDFYFKKEE